MTTLWLDDLAEEQEYADLRHMLEESLGPVQSATNEGDFFKSVRSENHKLYVIDFQLPDRSGVDVARELIAEKGDVAIIFFSEFVSQYRDIGHRLDPRARFATLVKPLGFEGGEAAHSELRKAVDALWWGESTTSGPDSTIDGPLAQLHPEVWDYGVEEFQDLDLDSQLSLISQGAAALRPFTDELFEESSADYVVVINNPLRVVLSGEIDNDPPSEELLEDLERTYGVIPLVVYRPVVVEMVGDSASNWKQCSPSTDRVIRNADEFPVLRLELNGHNRDSFHVDTGSVVSFLGYEDCLTSGFLGRITSYRSWYDMDVSTVASGDRRTTKFAFAEITAAAASLDGFISVKWKPRIVKDWRSTRLGRLCPFGRCENSTLVKGRGYWCGFRKGLVGRDLLRVNQILLIFDSIQRKTYVLDDLSQLVGAVDSGDSDQWEWSDDG